jgi:hypothetical protein
VAGHPLKRLDDFVGESIERSVRAHHGRRLRRHGSAEPIDPSSCGGWATTASFAPLGDCSVEPFVDGSEALPRMADAVSSARLHVHLAGWNFDPFFRLEGSIVADVAQHFLMRWHSVAGDGLPQPSVPTGSAGIEAQLVRTVPERLYEPCRNGEWSILESYLRALRAAERLVYLESQFLCRRRSASCLRRSCALLPATTSV